jgi:type I restriction enzyme M protein
VNRQLIKAYIDSSPVKVITSFDLVKQKIAYTDIKQCRTIIDLKGDEEVVRAYILTKLINELGYDSSRIEIEHEYTAGRPHTITTRIDVIVRDANNNAFLFIELKSPSDYTTIDKDVVIKEQMFKLAGMERSDSNSVKYLVLYTIKESGGKINDECIIIDNEKFPTFDNWVEAGRESVNELPKYYGKAQKRPYIKASEKDLETDFTHETLNRLQTDLHNVLWGGGGTDDNEIFSSLTNLILAKIQDEDEKEDGDSYDFQSMVFVKDGDGEFETNEQLFDKINNLYRRALKAKLYISNEDELRKSYVVDTKKFSLSKLKYTVQKLEGLSFVDGKNSFNDKDILGDFFEGIIRNGFKQSKGQFFTHTNVVRFMLWALQVDKLAIKRIRADKEIPYMIDPSAGSGTFLLEYMKFITQNIKNRFRSQLGNSRTIIDKLDTWFLPDNHEHKWAKDYIYANEINFNLGTAIKVNMILHGDGSTNIFVKDGLLPFSRYKKETAPNALNERITDALYNGLEVNAKFDLILTNPPFSVELDNDTKKTLSTGFIFGDKKNSENLFIERWYQLLRENGRLAAVLPDSIFDTTENKYIRIFLYRYFTIKAVVSLPQITFQPFTSTKTSILFAQKKTKEELEQWDLLWTETSKEYTYLKTRIENLLAIFDGKKQKNKLPSIKDLTTDEENEMLRKILKNHLTERDNGLDGKALILKYRAEIEDICNFDKDTSVYGFVNTWWVFSVVAEKLNYEVFMAEAENIGFKRMGGKHPREKPMPNDLFRTNVDGSVQVDDGISETILDHMRTISWT